MKTGMGSSLARGRRSCALLLAAVLLALTATAAAAAPVWDDESEMVATANRDTFIYAPPQNTRLSRGDLLAQGAYYADYGFNENFIQWAPEEPISVFEAAAWASCLRVPHSEPCPDALFNGFHAVADSVAGGSITTITWRGAYIALACGNFTQGGATPPTPAVAGVKYEDLNADGQRDAGEPGLAGWTMRLIFNGREVATTTTGSDGSYAFVLDAIRLEIGAGTYQVVEDQQSGWNAAEAPGAFNVEHGVGSHTFAGNDFGNYRNATISGHKFDDSDVDGLWDESELGLDGWTIQSSGGIPDALTDDDGAYSYSVRPGTYTVNEVLQDRWRQTAPSGAGTRTYTVVSGQVVSDADFGNVCLGDVEVQPVDESTGLPVTGMEVRIEEVSVPGVLTNDPSLPITTTGTPTFGDLLPGTYRIVAFLPEGVFTTDEDVQVVEGRFAIVKQVTVSECSPTNVPLDVFTASNGKVTGGMLRVLTPTGFATSGFEFMTVDRVPRGTLQFNDHVSGLKLHTKVVEGIHVDGMDATVWGKVTVGTATVRFLLRLVDAGEPGTADRYELTLATGYMAGFGGPIVGGNIQIHR